MQKLLGWVLASAAAAVTWLTVGCGNNHATSSATSITVTSNNDEASTRFILKCVDLSDPAQVTEQDAPVSLAAARNEWSSFALHVSWPAGAGYSLRLGMLRAAESARTASPIRFKVYQVVSAPVDLNRAGYVRHSGQNAATRSLPRALLPLDVSHDQILSLDRLRDSAHQPATLWIDLHTDATLPAGAYSANIDLLRAGAAQPAVSLPLKLIVHNFNLPNERHALMIGALDWVWLQNLFPAEFEAITPTWLNRADPKYEPTIRILDQMMSVAQEHRLSLYIPALRPLTKWPANAPPLIDWQNFDPMVAPWLSGSAFADHIAPHYWPIPSAEMLDRYDRKSQAEYWSAAATHFEQNRWLAVSGIPITRKGSSDADISAINTEAAELLKAIPQARIIVPLEDDQLQLGDVQNPSLIDPQSASRLLAVAQPLVSAPPRPWPAGVARPQHAVWTGFPGLFPYMGSGGSERDVRMWACLAFLRHLAEHGSNAGPDEAPVLWNVTLPQNSADQPADPNEIPWFYPGSWFGVSGPVPTLQLKWLRQAEQDYEYLRLAQERGEAITALQSARLIARPVEIQPDQPPDPIYSLLNGTADAAAWKQARQLLTESILLHTPGEPVEANRQESLYLRFMQWANPRERPLMIARSAEWSPSAPSTPAPANGTQRQNQVDLKLGVDLYNASESTPERNHVGWASVPAAWQIEPHELTVPKLGTYRVTRLNLSQKVDLDLISPETRRPVELLFTDSANQTTGNLKFVLPVATSERREGRLSIDGNLEDWLTSSPIQIGPLVRMLDRPSVQSQSASAAQVPTTLYSGWTSDNFYVAFSLQGISLPGQKAFHNFVDYQQRRAWGEDLCEILLQPILPRGEKSPIFHIVCKPNGTVTFERKANNQDPATPWAAVYGAEIRYAVNTTPSNWNGEVAIPWPLILGKAADPPKLMRFNFSQHRADNGQSASWAGPVDYGGDESFMGLLYIHTPDILRP